MNFTSDTVRELLHLMFESYFGLTEAQYRIIGRLKNFGPCTQQEISEAAHMDKMTVSRAARALVQRDFIHRRAHADDGRSHLLGLTANGTAVSFEIEARAVELETALLEDWTPEEIERFKSDLGRLADKARQQIALFGTVVPVHPDVPKVRRRR